VTSTQPPSYHDLQQQLQHLCITEYTSPITFTVTEGLDNENVAVTDMRGTPYQDDCSGYGPIEEVTTAELEEITANNDEGCSSTGQGDEQGFQVEREIQTPGNLPPTKLIPVKGGYGHSKNNHA